MAMHPAIIKIILISSIYAFCNAAAADIGLFVTEKSRAAIEASIAKHEDWKKGEYHLRMMHPWDNGRIPIVLAVQDRIKTSHEPAFVILKDGTPVSSRDPRAFNTILEEYFPAIEPADAAMVSELSLIFGTYPKYLGRLWKHRIDDKGFRNLSRGGSAPRFSKKGASCVIEFYSLSSGHRVADFYDCRLVVTGIDFKLTGRKLIK